MFVGGVGWGSCLTRKPTPKAPSLQVTEDTRAPSPSGLLEPYILIEAEHQPLRDCGGN